MTPDPLASAAFVFYELKKRDQSIVVEILCRQCYDTRPEAAHPLTEREIAAGYRYTVRPYAGDHECMQCERKPEQPKAEGYDETMRKVG